MEIVKVCRICLVMDVNMYDLQIQPFNTYFEAIIGNSFSVMDLPLFACFECAALVKKYYHFRAKCLRGQAALYKILHSNGKLTKQEIQKVNRPSLQLTSILTIHEMAKDNIIYHVYDEDSAGKIKKESINEDVIEKLKIEDSIKVEDGFDCVPLHPSTSDDEFEDSNKEEHLHDSTDDEEALPLHIRNKQEKVKDKKKRNCKSSNEKLNFNCLKSNKVTDYGTEISIDITEILPLKRKSGRCKKSKIKRRARSTKSGEVQEDDAHVGDLEDYVTIVKLSVEEQMDEINKRQQSSNYLNAPYQCKVCYKGFVYTHAWKHHVSKHDLSAGDMECPVCKLRFKSKCSLYKHSTNHETKYVCKSCSYVSSSITQAKRHQRWHKGITYKCQYCDEVSTKWTSYLSHVRIKHPSEFICDLCGYSFVSKLGLTLHKSRMHKGVHEKTDADNDKEVELYCKECDVKFISVDAFKRHTVTSAKHTHITHSNGCRVCGETFKNSEELRIHRREHARKFLKYYGDKPTDTTWPIKCEHCSEEILNGRDYWNHFRRAHPDKDYPVQKNHVCDICGKCFQSITFLGYHQRTHSEEKAFKCSACGKAFRNKGYLHLHEKTHSEVRPYPCTSCLKAFKFKGALDRHSRCHTGVKPFECEVCGKAFTQSNSRKLHIRTVHMKQPAPARSRLPRKNKS